MKKKRKKKKKTKSVTKQKWDYELINENKIIWLRDKKEITREEYVKFSKVLIKDSEDPLAYEHSKLEGEVNFRYILFIPGKRPYDLYDNYYGKSSSLKLYVRSVLVSEQFEDLMPRYLNFIKGMIKLSVEKEEDEDNDDEEENETESKNETEADAKPENDTKSDEDDEDEDKEKKEKKKDTK